MIYIMHIVSIAFVVAIVAALFATCVLMWYRTLKQIDVDVGEWDKRAFDDFYGEIGRFSRNSIFNGLRARQGDNDNEEEHTGEEEPASEEKRA